MLSVLVIISSVIEVGVRVMRETIQKVSLTFDSNMYCQLYLSMICRHSFSFFPFQTHAEV